MQNYRPRFQQPGNNFHQPGQANNNQQPRPCPHSFACTHVVKRAGCRNLHSEQDEYLAHSLNSIRHVTSSETVGYFFNNKVQLVINLDLPVHLSVGAVPIEIWEDHYYLFKVGELIRGIQSLEVKVLSDLGSIGDYEVEKLVLQKYMCKRPYYKEHVRQQEESKEETKEDSKGDSNEEDEEVKDAQEESKASSSDIEILTGRYQVRDQGASIKTQTHSDLFIFDKKSFADKNRAFHNCRVDFKIKPAPEANPNMNQVPQGRRQKQFAEIVNVRYPQTLFKYGILKAIKNLLYFIPMDKKYDKMLVREIQSEIFENIKRDPELQYSYVLQSQIKPEYLDKVFFKAQFIEWSVSEYYPYVRLIEECGRLDDAENYKNVIMLENGISQEMYNYNALKEAEGMIEQFEAQIEEEVKSRVDLSEEFIFTIDNSTSKALDDAISITQLTETTFKIGIHISDVAQLIAVDTSIDKEALKRAASTYVLKNFFLPMLPYNINSGICSLLPLEKRFAVSLHFIIDSEANIDVDSVKYDKSIILNKAKLSYQVADQIIQASQTKSIDNQKQEDEKNVPNQNVLASFSEEDRDKLTRSLTSLQQLMSKRREMRKLYDKVDEQERAYESMGMIEELMHIQNQLLPVYKKKVIDQANLSLKEMVDALPKPDLLSKSKSIKEVENLKVQDEFFAIIDFENGVQVQTSERAESYLRNLVFDKLNVVLETKSRKHIINSFQQAKDLRDSDVFSSFMDTVYAKNYQYFAHFVNRYQREHENDEIEEVKQEEDEKLIEASESQNPQEDAKKSMDQQIIDQFSQLNLLDPTNAFDNKLNGKIIVEYLATPKEQQIKFTNPIRDYCHLLSNRLLHLLIDLQKLLEDKDQTNEYIAELDQKIKAIVEHLRKQLLYQKEVKFIKQNDKKMKDAEREIMKILYAFEIMDLQQKTEKVLIVKKLGRVYESYHPQIQEFIVQPTGEQEIGIFTEVEVEMKLKSLVPLEFNSKIIENQAEEEQKEEQIIVA